MVPRQILLLSFSGVLFASCLTGRVEAIDPNNPPDGRFSDEWAEVFLNGKKIGYAHSTMARRGDMIETGNAMKMDLGRAGQTVRIMTEQETTETLLGRPRRFASIMSMAAIKTTTKGTIENGKVTIVTSQLGMNQEQTYDFPHGALMTWGLFRESLLRGFKPGTEYSLPVYAAELRLDGAVKASMKVGPWESFEHRGRKLGGHRVTAVMESPVGSVEMVSWVSRSGIPIKSTIPAPGIGDLEVISCDQATALADFVPPEIFMNTVVKAKRTIDTKHARKIRYRITAKNPEIDLSGLPSTGLQTVGNRSDGSVELVVARHHRQDGPKRADELQPHNLSEYLDDNLMINTKDPQLIKLAKRAVGQETEPYVVADKLRRFVTDYVQIKSLTVGFATASEVGRTRQGDCSEHAVLLAALGRIQGLPSRVVIGLAYVPQFGGQTDIFGYHMWTQFHIDGRWVDSDAALRESDCSPARIAFVTSSLKNAGLADLTLPLISKIGAIDIEILEVEGGYAPADADP